MKHWQGVEREIEAPLKILYKNAGGGDFHADLPVAEIIIVELKTAKTYNADDEPQRLNELKGTGINAGLLINFGRTKVEFKRMVFQMKSLWFRV